MKRSKIALFIIYGLFHIGLLIFILIIDNKAPDDIADIDPEDFVDLLKLQPLAPMAKYLPIAKYIAFFGILLYVINTIFFWVMAKSHSSKLAEVEKEKNLYKAKMYDMQETLNEATKRPAQTQITTDEDSSENE